MAINNTLSKGLIIPRGASLGVTGNNANQPHSAFNAGILSSAPLVQPKPLAAAPKPVSAVKPAVKPQVAQPALSTISTISTQNASLGGAQSPSAPIQGLMAPPNIGMGTGGGKAPSGQEYGPDGLLRPTNSFGGLVGTLSQTASQNNPGFEAAQKQYNTANQQLADLKKAAANNQFIGAGTNMAEYAGTQGLLANRLANEENALTGEMTAAQAAAQAATGQQNVQQSGLGTAAGLASPQQVPYSNQYISPLNGQSVGGGGVGQLPPDAQNAVNLYADQVRSGSMTRSDAEARLAPYGVAGTNALAQALGANFNTNASNASAGTTAVGQQVKTAAASTNQALDTLASAFNSLNSLQTGGIPATNSIAQWIGNQFGSAKLSDYNRILHDARSQLLGVLNSSGGTPTGNEQTAFQYLPDNMTKEQFLTAVGDGTAAHPGTVRQLMQQKVGSFTGSGQQNQSSGLYNW